MKKNSNGRIWREFSSKMEQVPYSSTFLTDWIDYYLWEGGKSSEIERKVKEKAGELKHRGYNGAKRLFDLNALKKGELKPQERSLLGHIARRAMERDYKIEINGIPISNSLREISTDEAIKKNDFITKLFYEQNAYTRIEGFKGEMRPDKVKDLIGESPASIANYLPTKLDVDLASKQVPLGVRGHLDAILDQVEKNSLAANKSLKNNWRIITERNIANWFK